MSQTSITQFGVNKIRWGKCHAISYWPIYEPCTCLVSNSGCFCSIKSTSPILTTKNYIALSIISYKNIWICIYPFCENVSDVLCFHPAGWKASGTWFSFEWVVGWAWAAGQTKPPLVPTGPHFWRIIFGHVKGINCPSVSNFDYGGSAFLNLLTMNHSVNWSIFGPILRGLPSSNVFFCLSYSVVKNTYDIGS